MNISNEDEVLDLFRRLHERLQQANGNTPNGNNPNGSHNTIVYVAPGAQYVNNLYQQPPLPGLTPGPSPKGEGNIKGQELPEKLSSPEAMALWQRVQEAGYVDARYQPLISRTQAALLADAMAERLGIREKWKVFEAFWDRKNMRGDYSRAMSQRQSLDLQDQLKQLLSECS